MATVLYGLSQNSTAPPVQVVYFVTTTKFGKKAGEDKIPALHAMA